MTTFAWSSWADFAAMGGYGLYVWGSFGMAALLVVAELLSLRHRRAALLQPDEAAAPVYEGIVHEA